MHLLGRLYSLVSAKAHTLVDRFEVPEEMATHTLRELEEKLGTLRQQAAMAVAVERRLHRELKRASAQAHHVKEQARLALAQEREDLARWAVAQNLSQQDVIRDLQAQYDAARQANLEIRQALQALGARCTESRRRHLLLAARHRSARVRLAVHQALETEHATSDAMSAKLTRWEDQWAEAADVLLARVEISRPPHDEAAQLAALEVNRRVEQELAELKREKPPTSGQ